MDNSNHQPMNRQIDPLGVNRTGKSIAKNNKSPLHQPNFPNAGRQLPQPQVYNIDKNDFRNVVQQLTGSPSRESPPPRPLPQNNNPKAPNHRLHRVRPPPLAPSRPQAPAGSRSPVPQPMVQPPYPNAFVRPLPPQSQYDHQPSPPVLLPPTPNDVWANTTESPISAYMNYLQNSIIGSGPRPSHPGPPPNEPPSLHANGPHHNLPSHRMHVPPPMLPSPTSQFLLPSPNGFLNLLSPRSPYPLLSPGFAHPPPVSPTFSFNQAGILGPRPPQPPPSPGYGFPLSPGFFSITSPRWRAQ